MAEREAWPVRDYANKAYQRRMRHALNDQIQMCGCGTVEHKWPLLLAMLERAEDHKTRGYFYDAMGDIPPRAVEFIAHAMDGWGLLEHGTSIGGAWLTQDGSEVLAFLREFGTDDGTAIGGIWPDWWCSCGVEEQW